MVTESFKQPKTSFLQSLNTRQKEKHGLGRIACVIDLMSLEVSLQTISLALKVSHSAVSGFVYFAKIMKTIKHKQLLPERLDDTLQNFGAKQIPLALLAVF